ncbi:MAG: acetyl-CoA carboxylase biotin carboxylase subunit family protein [Catenulispora sp.]
MDYQTTYAAAKPDAFILGGAFRVICRNPRFLSELADRSLRILIVTPDSSRAQTEAVLARGGATAELISEVAFVPGAMDVESSFNPGVLAAVQQWRESYRIVGAYAMEEMLVEPISLVCDILGLPGPGLRAGRACRSKYLQRAYLDRFGPASLTVPPGLRATVDPAALKLPAVVKPAARHASSGVVACESADQVAAVLRAYPDHETVLIEQRAEGPEFSVESLVQDGEVRFASVTRKQTTDTVGRTFVELSHTVPADAPGAGAAAAGPAVLAANRAVLADLAFADGIAHSEWRVPDNGEPCLMEIAARTPGDGLTPLYHLACGEPIEDQIIKIALGEPARYPAPRRYARQVYLDHRPGILADVALDWPGISVAWVGPADLWPPITPGAPEDGPTLRAVLALKPRGARLEPLSSSDDRAVTFFIDARTPEELDELEARVRAALRVRITPSGQE